MEFKKIMVEDAGLLIPYLIDEREFTCETTVANLAMWQSLYNNQYCIEDDILFLKSAFLGGDIFNLPYGDAKKGMALLREYSGEKYPNIWAQEGARFDEFVKNYGEFYNMDESRNEFDYIYKRENLAELSGKKYHSKRNHISAFTRQWDWHYEKIDSHNIDLVRECASCWYAENSDRMDLFLKTEQHGISLVLDNMELLGVVGGAVFVGGRVVAFTLGTPINNEVFDVHYEKALKNYDTAYTVINNQFVKNELSAYKYINREDDIGLEGLRKAKLSYKPTVLLEKFYCTGRQGND